MSSYKGIEFAKGYNKPFADFKKEFSSTHIFNKLPEDNLKEELEKAYKIATDGNIVKHAKQRKETESKKIRGGSVQRDKTSGSDDTAP